MEGKKVVITSDRSLFSTHRNSFYFGFISVFPTKVIPGFLQRHVFCPPPPTYANGTAKYALVAHRCVEASFIRNGFSENEVVVAHPNQLDKFIGKRTEFVCVSTQDPLGIGPVTTTWSSLMKGTPYNRIEFKRLLVHELTPLKENFGFKVAVGGPGSWQLSSKPILARFNIDYLAMGEAETIIPKLISIPNQQIITSSPPEPSEVPSIRHPIVGGLIEITRGCGLGCAYCSPNLSGRLRSFPLTKIQSDAIVNAKMGGSKTITMHSDNALNFGSQTRIPDEDAIMELYNSLFSIDGVQRVNMTHTCLAPFAYMPEFITKLTKLLRKHGHRYYVCQPGIETGSPRLMKQLMPHKCHPYSPEEWPEVVKEAFSVMNNHRWICATTIMIGLPGEEKEDIRQTIALVRFLDKFNSILFVPIFFNAISSTRAGIHEDFLSHKMTPENSKLLELCWKHNVRIARKLYYLASSENHPLFTRTIIELGIQSLKLAAKLYTIYYNKHG
ncbi:MAG: B12-binding domain-containing radical SAM protein [Candidatus Hodarchaeota archaeon]